MFNIERNFQLEKMDVKKLYRLYKSNELDISPYYQRFSNLWPDSKKRLLIDTIINGYDMPKFYFHYIIVNKNPLNPTDKRYAIIDGKQRVNALVDFIEGRLKLDVSVKWLEKPSISLKNISYTQMSQKNELKELKNRFDNFQLDVIHVNTDESDRIEEMFLRLNEGLPVNNAEKRNSMGGYLIEEINSLVKKSIFFTDKARFGNKRMEHNDLISKLCLIEAYSNLESFTKRNLDILVRNYKPKKNLNPNELMKLKNQAKVLINIVENGLLKLCEVFDDNDKLLRYRGVIPLYYLFIKRFEIKIFKRYKLFLDKFDETKMINRKIEKHKTINSTLLEFDRLNQQGAHQSKSLEIRLKIMRFYYTKNNFDFIDEMPPSEIGLDSDYESV